MIQCCLSIVGVLVTCDIMVNCSLSTFLELFPHYASDAHDFPTSGVFEVEPRQCPGFKFRKANLHENDNLDSTEVREFMKQQSPNYYGDMYYLIIKTCNHFYDDICYKLTGRRIPEWVNRLARIGSVCSCILLDSLKVTMTPEPELEAYDSQIYDSETKHLRRFNGFLSMSMSQKEDEISSLLLHSNYGGYLPPWQLTRTRPEILEDVPSTLLYISRPAAGVAHKFSAYYISVEGEEDNEGGRGQKQGPTYRKRR